MRPINADACHDALVAGIKGSLAYDSSRDFGLWKAQVEQKLTALLGMDVIGEKACPIQIEADEPVDLEQYRLIAEVDLHLLFEGYRRQNDLNNREIRVFISHVLLTERFDDPLFAVFLEKFIIPLFWCPAYELISLFAGNGRKIQGG